LFVDIVFLFDVRQPGVIEASRILAEESTLGLQKFRAIHRYALPCEVVNPL